MPFRPPRPVTARWRPGKGDGLQQVTLTPVADGIRTDGVIIGGTGKGTYGVRFRLVCDTGWRTLGLDLDTLDGRELHLRSDGGGTWRGGDGRALPRFDGCIDLDLQGSPFTNTLPIRRLDLAPGDGPRLIAALYVPFDTFEPFVDRQRYRCLAAGTRYGYEAADGSFSAEITVDEDGLVVDYPPLFHRVPL